VADLTHSHGRLRNAHYKVWLLHHSVWLLRNMREGRAKLRFQNTTLETGISIHVLTMVNTAIPIGIGVIPMLVRGLRGCSGRSRLD